MWVSKWKVSLGQDSIIFYYDTIHSKWQINFFFKMGKDLMQSPWYLGNVLGSFIWNATCPDTYDQYYCRGGDKKKNISEPSHI